MKRRPAKDSMKKQRKSRPGRGALILIAALLMSSALVRVSQDAGRAFARQSDATEVAQNQIGKPDPENCTPAPDLVAMLAAFQEREKRVEEREFQIRARMKALTVVDQEISKKLTALTHAEEELRKTLATADSAAENDLSRLTTVYENMKPKDASALFETMDPSFSAGFLGRMRPESAAAILAGLTPQTAYTVSAVLAGRNASVPKE